MLKKGALLFTHSTQTYRLIIMRVARLFFASFLCSFVYICLQQKMWFWHFLMLKITNAFASLLPAWMPQSPILWKRTLYKPHIWNNLSSVQLLWSSVKNNLCVTYAKSIWFAFKITGSLCLIWIIYGYTRKQKHQSQSRLSSLWRFRSSLWLARKTSPIKIDRLPLIKGTETQHTLLVGTTGSGKSNALYHMLSHIRRNNHKALVVDATGIITQHWMRKEDVLFHPSDPSTHAWDVFEDYKTDEDFAHFANTMIPHQGSDPFWSHAAQTVLRTIMTLSQTGGIPHLRSLLFETSLPNLIDILSTTPAQTLLTKEADKTAGSIVAHLNGQTQGLRFLKTPQEIIQDRKTKNRYLRRQEFSTNHAPSFSIQKWVTDPDPSWLFLTTEPHHRTALLPIISAVIDTTLRALMRQNPNTLARSWIILDELPALQKLPTLTTFAAEGRKYGAALVACIQSLAQLEERYGRTTSQVLLDLFGTKIAFRSPNADTAHWISRSFGTHNTSVSHENIGLSAQHTPQWSASTSQTSAPIITPQEIMNLKDLEAFAHFPGHWPCVSFTMRYKRI